jgi:hypothetical protein
MKLLKKRRKKKLLKQKELHSLVGTGQKRRNRMHLSWNDIYTLEDLSDQELREIIKDSTKVLTVVKQSVDRRGISPYGLSVEKMQDFIDAVVNNIKVEIARREIAYDRTRLLPFKTLSIKDLTIAQELPEGELIRGYLMRRREKTGEEMTIEDMQNTEITI